jgi:hypothetical protein
MCDICDCNPVKYGEIMPGWTLARAATTNPYWSAGQWALLFGEDAYVVWDDPCPVIDPMFDMSDEQIDALPEGWLKSNMAIIAATREWAKRLHYVNGMHDAAALLASCIACGWDVEEHGSPEVWLAQRVARAVQKAES